MLVFMFVTLHALVVNFLLYFAWFFKVFFICINSVRCHNNLFEKHYVQKAIKVATFPIPIAYWSGFRIFKLLWENPD